MSGCQILHNGTVPFCGDAVTAGAKVLADWSLCGQKALSVAR
jgi:hypothetical protein